MKAKKTPKKCVVVSRGKCVVIARRRSVRLAKAA